MWRISVALLTLLIAAPAYSNPPSPAPAKASHQPEASPKQHEENPATDHRGSETSPVFIKVIPPQALEPQATKEAEKGQDYSSPEWWLVYVTGTLVAATCGLITYTAFLWGATKKLVIGADKTAKEQLRAYVGVETVQVRELGIELRGVVTLANFGQTMAKELEFWIAGAFEVATRQEFPWGDRKLKTVIMPGERVMFEEPVKYGRHELEMMDQGLTHGLLWGKITYTDVFGKNHWTIFRFVTYERAGDGWKTRASQEGNDAGDGEPPLPLTS